MRNVAVLVPTNTPQASMSCNESTEQNHEQNAGEDADDYERRCLRNEDPRRDEGRHETRLRQLILDRLEGA